MFNLVGNLSEEQRERLKPSTKETLLVALIGLLLVAAIVVPIVVCSKSEEKPANKLDGTVKINKNEVITKDPSAVAKSNLQGKF